ncbi:alkylated DNA repair protein alkB homolog 8-like [Patiria miniata]|uniref:tRNA (carboxymethyluridine(34)-5-O)-methyltransferase n=1 Tax=Patiria miniata TaxID=46514 RepID=A0A913ZV48_PATMI|nr:alkylated DNA repair protein alkB homolog 8-like [Patiria miniata]
MADDGSVARARNTREGPGKLSKSERKLARKQAKSRHTLLRHEGIHAAKLPTKHLIVGNGGLGNGVSRNDLKPLFSQYGQLTDIVMLPGKPYSIICYASVEEAVKAHDCLQGWQLRPPDGPTAAVILYLSFINEVPLPKMTSGQHSLPPGLILLENFIDVETEAALMGEMLWEQGDQSEEAVRSTLKHRKVKHFGYEFNYATNNVDKDSPIPEPVPPLYVDVIDRIMATGLVQNRPDQITVNEYQPGQGIPPHVDTHSAFQEAIISLSLGSQVLMEFSNPTTGRQVPVFLPRRSLLIMTGEARYLWSHGITPRKSDVIPAHVDLTNGSPASHDVTENDDGLTLLHRGVRRSLTFRAVRGAPCHCAYPSRCDTRLSSANSDPLAASPAAPSLPTSDLQALHLETTHVHQVYDTIAGHFSQTRHKPWPRVLEFLQSLPAGSVMLDVGCGNGKYLDGNPSVFSIGCDRSVKLVEICKERHFQAFSCDGLNLPIRSSSMDACICIAVIHHFSTQNRRLAAVREMARVLRPEGLGLIYVWAKEQEKDRKKSHYISNATHKKKKSALTAVADGIDKDDTGLCQDEELKDDRPKRSVDIQQSERLSTEDETSNCRNVPSGCLSMNAASTDHTRTEVEHCTMTSEFQNPLGPDETLESNASPSLSGDSGASSERPEFTSDKSSVQPKGASTLLSIHKNRTEFESQDMLVPWHLKKQPSKKDSCAPLQENGPAGEDDSPVYHRFYHVFHEGELEELCGLVDRVEIKSSHYDQGNWGIVIRKL